MGIGTILIIAWCIIWFFVIVPLGIRYLVQIIREEKEKPRDTPRPVKTKAFTSFPFSEFSQPENTHELHQGCNVFLAPNDPDAIPVYLSPGSFGAIRVRLNPNARDAIPVALLPGARGATPISLV